jgi:hypothetical protein
MVKYFLYFPSTTYSWLQFLALVHRSPKPIYFIAKNGNRGSFRQVQKAQHRYYHHRPTARLAALPAGLCLQAARAEAVDEQRFEFRAGIHRRFRLRPQPRDLPDQPVSGQARNDRYPNLAHVLEKAGYKTRAWLGKWHLGEIDTSPLEAGFTEWDDPDAGITISDYNTLGGGEADNDSRYLADMLKFIERQEENAEDPFCLVASFVNPHDGFVAFRGLGGSGYASSTLTEAIVDLPHNYRQHQNDLRLDNLHHPEPRTHASARWWTFAKPGSKMPPKHRPQDYVNFYAYLQILVDKQIELGFVGAIAGAARLASRLMGGMKTLLRIFKQLGHQLLG